MLPAADLAEIISNLAALHLTPDTSAAVLGAVLAPLLRSSAPSVEIPVPLPQKPGRPPGSPRRKRKRSASRAAAAESTDSPRQRAARALAANPGVSLTRLAKIAGVSRSTVVNARSALGAEARKQVRKEASKSLKPETMERRERAQRFLQDTLALGPKRVSDVEEAAEKAHIDVHTLQQARGDLGIVTSRGNTGGAHAVQWSLLSDRLGAAGSIASHIAGQSGLFFGRVVPDCEHGPYGQAAQS